MTDEELAALRATRAAMTPGEWEWDPRWGLLLAGEDGIGLVHLDRPDGTGIAACVNAVDGLLDDVERLRDDSDLDGTDFAHPAFARGQSYATTVLCDMINKILDGEEPVGVAAEPWESTRRRVAALRRENERLQRGVYVLGLGGHGYTGRVVGVTENAQPAPDDEEENRGTSD